MKNNCIGVETVDCEQILKSKSLQVSVYLKKKQKKLLQ